jgi:hypothetical protein
VLGVVLLAVRGSHAGQIIQEKSITERRTNFTDNSTLAFDQFDDQGGSRRLLSVELELHRSLATEVFIPAPPAGAVITVRVGSQNDRPSLRNAAPLGVLFDPFDSASSTDLLSLDPLEIVWSHTEGADFHRTWFNAPVDRSVVFDRLIDLDRFVGTNRFTFESLGRSNASYSSSTGSGSAIIITSADVRVRLRYNFLEVQQVPEPSSLALIGIGGGLGLVVFRRWRSRRRFPPS